MQMAGLFPSCPRLRWEHLSCSGKTRGDKGAGHMGKEAATRGCLVIRVEGKGVPEEAVTRARVLCLSPPSVSRFLLPITT